jgi:hypothetical protein
MFVIQNAPVGAQDQIVFTRVHGKVVHRDVRHVVVHLHPAGTAIDGHEHARVVADKQQIRVLRVLEHHVDGLAGQIGRDRRPVRAEILRAIHVRFEVIELVAALRHVGAARCVR